MFNRAAHLKTRRWSGLAVFLKLLEPVMILVRGRVVLLIVLATLLSIIEINPLVHSSGSKCADAWRFMKITHFRVRSGACAHRETRPEVVD